MQQARLQEPEQAQAQARLVPPREREPLLQVRAQVPVRLLVQAQEPAVAVRAAVLGPPLPRAIRLAKSTRILPVSSFLVFPQFSRTARLEQAAGGPGFGRGDPRPDERQRNAFYHPLGAHRKLLSDRCFEAFYAVPSRFTP